jgi:transposase-like protein
MDPQTQFCHNPDCTARGQLGLGNISVHSRKEQRYRCSTCGRTFAATHYSGPRFLDHPASYT